MFSALLSPNFMPSLRKIVGAVFEICHHVRTHGRSLYYRSPFFKPGTNNLFFYIKWIKISLRWHNPSGDGICAEKVTVEKICGEKSHYGQRSAVNLHFLRLRK